MRAIYLGNDLVLLSFLAAVLKDAGIASAVLDAHMSVPEGSIGALPRRLAVADEDLAAARRVLRQSGFEPSE